jgi:hypothetical protein
MTDTGMKQCSIVRHKEYLNFTRKIVPLLDITYYIICNRVGNSFFKIKKGEVS